MHFIVAIYNIRHNIHKYKTSLVVGSISYESKEVSECLKIMDFTFYS